MGEPTTQEVAFVVLEGFARQGQFVEIEDGEKRYLALVTEVKAGNRYFLNPEVVKEFPRIEEYAPTEGWLYVVAVARPLYQEIGGKRERVSIPPSPGSRVKTADPDTLKSFLGFKERGIYVGNVLYHEEVKAVIDMERLFRKHLAILAMSGAGKSHLASVLIEELLNYPGGRPAVVILDVHGEYAGLQGMSKDVEIVTEPRMGAYELRHRDIIKLLPDLSQTQERELYNVLSGMEGSYSLEDIMESVKKKVSNEVTKRILLQYLQRLAEGSVIGANTVPDPEEIRAGKVYVIDLSHIVSMFEKQVYVTYFLSKLFELRRENKIPPVIVVVEEAHNFVPEQKERREAIAREIIETIAREGRKFAMSLVIISQRPVKLSTTVLSQCNTHILLRITNPRDLEHVKESSEAIDERSIRMLTTLQRGEALIVGEAVNFPVFVKVRERTFESPYEKTIEEIAREWMEREGKRVTDAELL